MHIERPDAHMIFNDDRLTVVYVVVQTVYGVGFVLVGVDLVDLFLVLIYHLLKLLLGVLFGDFGHLDLFFEEQKSVLLDPQHS